MLWPTACLLIIFYSADVDPRSVFADVEVCICAESATGIREGGRTGIVGVTVAFWMFIALWFTPIIGEHASCLAVVNSQKADTATDQLPD